MAPHRGRRDDAIADAVVGQVEQRAKVVLVAGNALFHVGVAIGRGRRALQHEPALRADRDDDDVLHHLRLHEAQDLGAEILGAVGPAQPAAGNPAAAQVDAFESRRIDEYLEHRPRLGKARHFRGVELERHERAPARVRVAAPEIGPRRREDQREELSQHAVLGKILDLLERGLDRADVFGSRRVALRRLRRVEARLEEREQVAGDAGVRRKRRLDERLRQREPDLPQIFRVGAQDDDLERGHARRDHQAVEIVVLDFAAEDAAERVLEHRLQRLRVGVEQRRLDAEVVQPDRRLRRRRDLVRPLVDHPEAHPLEHREAVGERHRRADVEELEAQRPRLGVGRTVQRHPERSLGRQARHQLDVGDRCVRGDVVAVTRRQRAGELAIERVAARFAERRDERVAQVVVPAAGSLGEPFLELADVVGRNLPGHGPHGDQHARERRLGELHVELRARSVERLQQDRLPLLAQLRRVVLARRIDHAREEALEHVAPDEEAETLPLAEMQDPHRRREELVLADLEELVARVVVEDVDERLARVPALREARSRDDVRNLQAQHRNVGRLGPVGPRRVQAEKSMLAADVARVVEALDADVVEIAGAMDRRARVRLRHDQEVRHARVRAHLRRQRREARRDVGRRIDVQDAETGDDAQRVLAVDLDQLVTAVAEEREVVAAKPARGTP